MTRMGNALIPLTDIQKMAQVAVQSQLFGVKTEAEALALMLLAQSEGLHPMSAVRQFHIIQGRATMKAEAMLARFQQAGGKVRWDHSDAKCARATFSHEQSGELTVEWTIERAERIKLTGKDTWRNYPEAMLRARVITEGVRACLPGCTLGIMSEEEVDTNPAEVLPTEVVIGATVGTTVSDLKPAPVLATTLELGRLVTLMREAGIADDKAIAFIRDHVHRDVQKLSQLSAQEVGLLMSELEEIPKP